ncbi:hypothetical protein JQ596_24675 [Bradyrhizobium manausense]|uniref:hypothetical protein n=1 Tax=Bradyrhizobium manausense TaxID=989370 RepID=UPI001BABAE65|nr:hypothetical protein [Bradyrhizobium manausense]MBR0828736.1 hypothetical protein [Bradyrhizobium manausense]
MSLSFPPFLAFSGAGVAGPRKEIIGLARRATYHGHPQHVAEKITLNAVQQFSDAFVIVVVDDWSGLHGWHSHEPVVDNNFLLSAHRNVARRMSDSVTQVTKVETLLLSLDKDNAATPVVEHFEPAWEHHETGEPQGRLSFSETFLPSNEAVSIWIDALRQKAIDARRKDIELAFAAASPQERFHEFANLFRSTIGSFAQFTRYEGGDPTIIRSGQFMANFQRALNQQFDVIPNDIPRFNRVLAEDFTRALRKGWRVEGEWGFVEQVGSLEVRLNLRPVELFEDPEFVESEDVE